MRRKNVVLLLCIPFFLLSGVLFLYDQPEQNVRSEENGELFPEIEIYELIGQKPRTVHGVMHYIDREKQTFDRFDYTYLEEILPDKYVITFEWLPDEIVWYLDEKRVYSIKHDIPNIPMYMIFNLAVGGDWQKDPDETTIFPSSFGVEILEFRPQEIYIQ